jgi:hypothetical protein
VPPGGPRRPESSGSMDIVRVLLVDDETELVAYVLRL